MKSVNLLLKSLRSGLSFDANKRIAPYFWGCIGWLSVASAIVPSIAFAELIGGGVFFVFMTSLLINEDREQSESLSLERLAERLLDLLIISIISIIIIAVGLLLLFVPGVIASKQIIYSGLIVALGKAGPIEAFKMSKSLSMENGYSLLGSIFLLMLMWALPVAFFMSSPMESFQAQGGFGTILMIIYNLINAWFSYVVLNHMIIIAYKEAVIKKG